MQFKLIVQTLNKTSNATTAGTTEKMIVRLRVPDGSMKAPVEGMALRDGQELMVVITDPAKFETFKPGQEVKVNVTVASTEPPSEEGG